MDVPEREAGQGDRGQRAADTLADRVLITYVAAVPADGADAVAAGEKLGKVRWVNRQKLVT